MKLIYMLLCFIIFTATAAFAEQSIDSQTFSTTLPNETFFNNLKQEQFAIFKNTENVGKHNKKYVDIASIEYAMTLGAEGDKVAENWVKEILEDQFKLLDPVWGGIYAYSTNDWDHPDFAKLTFIQAEDIRLYAEAYAYWKNPIFLLVAEKNLDYIDNFLTSPEGVFYAGQAAYINSSGQQDAAYYKLNNIQRRQLGIPPIDKNIYPRENGVIINCLAYMYMITGNEIYLSKALRATDWIIKNLSLPDGGFQHTLNNHQQLYMSDTLAMSIAFLTLYRITMDQQYLIRSEQGLNFINKNFKNPNGPGYIETISKDNKQIKPEIDTYANAYLARFAMLLFYYTDNKIYKEIANNVMGYLIIPAITKNYYPALILLAHDRMQNAPLKIIVFGYKQNLIAKQLYEYALNYPSFYVQTEWCQKQEACLSAENYPTSNVPVAYVCVNKHCSLPITNPNDLHMIINQLVFNPKIANDILTTAPPVEKQMLQSQESQAPVVTPKAIALLTSHNLPLIILGFWIFGILLAFTPCVLPMILLISVLIAGGSEKISHSKMWGLTITYLLTLAITYSILGIIAALTGVYIQNYLQNFWVIGSLSLIFFLLGLSLLGFYQIKIPLQWRHALIKINNVNAVYSYLGVISMAVIVTLIAAPCAAAPLLGTIIYIVNTHNILLGWFGLLVMGLGIGTPLLLVTAFGKNVAIVSPKIQESINTIFGLFLIAISIIWVHRVISDYWTMIFISAFAIVLSIYMGLLKKQKQGGYGKFLKMLSVIVFGYGIALLIGAFMGNTNLLLPLKYNQSTTAISNANFQSIQNMRELQNVFNTAIADHKPIIIDVTAKWCDTCAEIERNVFSDFEVKNLLSQFALIRIDLTDATSEKREILKHFNIISPPTIVFFDTNGNELQNYRIYNDINAETFANILKNILNNK